MGVTTSVVICAYTEKRWDQLVAAVESVQAQDEPVGQIVLVLDHHDGLLDKASERWPTLTVLANSGPQGLSAARNTGIEASWGDIVLFLDDDAVADPDWARRLTAPYSDPTILGVGGSAQPMWQQPPPAWWPREFGWVVGCSYRGQPTSVAPVRNLMGCNMSVRREVFARVGGFAEDLGRIGRNPLGCEETELCIRIRQTYRRMGRDARVVFEPAAQVDHRVSGDRVRWAYLRRRSWSEGLSKAAVARLVGSEDALSTERSYVATVLPRAVLRELRAGRVASAAAVVAALAATTAGYLRGRLPGATSEVRLPAAESAVPAADAVAAGTGGA